MKSAAAIGIAKDRVVGSERIVAGGVPEGLEGADGMDLAEIRLITPSVEGPQVGPRGLSLHPKCWA
jgi:hypothetical protein